jgi:hypothetical protein
MALRVMLAWFDFKKEKVSQSGGASLCGIRKVYLWITLFKQNG